MSHSQPHNMTNSIRHTNDDTLGSVHISVKSAANVSLNEVTYAHIKSCTISRSHTFADSTTAASNSHNSETSRYVFRLFYLFANSSPDYTTCNILSHLCFKFLALAKTIAFSCRCNPSLACMQHLQHEYASAIMFASHPHFTTLILNLILTHPQSHQNKFHIATIRALTAKFASIKDGDIVHAGDKELWEYFANLYKNSNKGIKGRGKDRKVGPNSMAHNNPMRSLNVVTSRGGGYGMAGPGRGNMVVGVNVPRGGEGGQYEMFDVDDGSQSAGSSASTCYEDAPDGFEDSTHGRDLAFGDRIY